MSYKITTDSTVDLNPARMQELGVPFASLHLLLEGQDILDDMQASSAMHLYNQMREGKVGTTSQATVESFIDIWNPILEAGEDVLYLGFSSALSGTVNSANTARAQLLEKYPARTIHIVDTLCASAGEGLLLEHAVDIKSKGTKLEAAYEQLQKLKMRINHWFTVDDLAYLKRGGRISSAAALFATLLNIKPVMRVDDEGRLVPYEKTKGRRSAVKRLFTLLLEKIDEAATLGINISQADCMEDATNLKNMIRDKFPHIPVNIYSVGAVIGAHAGPGTLALFFVGKAPNRAV